MHLNADCDRRVVIDPADRQFVEGWNGQVCLLESLPDQRESLFLKLLPGVGLSPEASRKDREILVLEGAVEVGGREWSKGSYLRLAGDLGDHGISAREEGALLFVKIGTFPEEDRRSIGIATAESSWSPGLVEGLSVLPLFSDGTANTALVRWAPGTVFQPHRHFGGEEILVLSGVFEDEYGAYPEGSWYRAPHMSRHHPFSTRGCTIFVKTGHLLAGSAA